MGFFDVAAVVCRCRLARCRLPYRYGSVGWTRRVPDLSLHGCCRSESWTVVHWIFVAERVYPTETEAETTQRNGVIL